MIARETWIVLGKKREKISRFFIENSDTYNLVENFEYGFVLGLSAPDVAERFGIPAAWRFAGRVTPEEVLFSELNRHEERCAFIESCTGGLCCAKLTEMPGSSHVLWGGWVVYANEAKLLLGVSEEVLGTYGAVSKQTVLDLAGAGRGKSGANWCVSISGIAGPEGGNSSKPVGTVWIGIQGEKRRGKAFQFRFFGERSSIREKACTAAFLILYCYVQREKKSSC